MLSVYQATNFEMRVWRDSGIFIVLPLGPISGIDSFSSAFYSLSAIG
jgi:hypothetical protein